MLLCLHCCRPGTRMLLSGRRKKLGGESLKEGVVRQCDCGPTAVAAWVVMIEKTEFAQCCCAAMDSGKGVAHPQLHSWPAAMSCSPNMHITPLLAPSCQDTAHNVSSNSKARFALPCHACPTGMWTACITQPSVAGAASQALAAGGVLRRAPAPTAPLTSPSTSL